MNREGILDKLFAVWATRRGWRTFRNSVGVGYVGKELRSYPSSTRAGAAMVFEIIGRRIRFGLCEGSSDRIGWRTVRITPEMVGSRIAQFVAAELKTENVRTTREQINFLTQVNRAGGYGVIVREKDGQIELDEGKVVDLCAEPHQ